MSVTIGDRPVTDEDIRRIQTLQRRLPSLRRQAKSQRPARVPHRHGGLNSTVSPALGLAMTESFLTRATFLTALP